MISIQLKTDMKARASYRFIVSGGGTGGHIFPAIAIADALRDLYGAEILFIGAKGRMEMEKVPAAGYTIEGLNIAGLQRKLDPNNLLLPFLLVGAVFRAFDILRKYRPNAVIGVGGYASAPVMIASLLSGIPVFIQEQNAFAGLTNKALGQFASRIYVAFDGMEKFFPKSKIRVLGNPIRKELQQPFTNRKEAFQMFELDEQRPVLLVVGGSLGARAINQAISQLLEKMIENKIQVIWQTGKGGYELALKAANGLEGVKVHAFISKMDWAYAVADLVISRAGALACSELCALGKASILVPSPYVAEDHQTVNARSLTEHQAAVMLNEKELNLKLEQTLFKLMNDSEARLMLSSQAVSLGKPHAASDIAHDLMNFIQGHGKTV